MENPYEAGKSVPDPQWEVRLKCEKSSFDNFKIQSLSDGFCDVPLFPLNGLHSAPVISKDFNSSSFKAEDLPLFYAPWFYTWYQRDTLQGL